MPRPPRVYGTLMDCVIIIRDFVILLIDCVSEQFFVDGAPCVHVGVDALSGRRDIVRLGSNPRAQSNRASSVQSHSEQWRCVGQCHTHRQFVQ